MHTLDELDAAQLRSDIPDFRPGDTLDVGVRVVEGNRSRVQRFQGVVIRRQGGGVRETFTVRKVSFGVGVERTFPVHTPVIEDIKVVTRGDVRRAKLYYLRELRGKKAKIKEKRDAVPAKAAAKAAPKAYLRLVPTPRPASGRGVGMSARRGPRRSTGAVPRAGRGLVRPWMALSSPASHASAPSCAPVQLLPCAGCPCGAPGSGTARRASEPCPGS